MGSDAVVGLVTGSGRKEPREPSPSESGEESDQPPPKKKPERDEEVVRRFFELTRQLKERRINPKKYATGALRRMDESSVFIRVNFVCPAPVKRPFEININGTIR